MVAVRHFSLMLSMKKWGGRERNVMFFIFLRNSVRKRFRASFLISILLKMMSVD